MEGIEIGVAICSREVCLCVYCRDLVGVSLTLYCVVCVQVTNREVQVALLSPLELKLRQACAMGRRDRRRGDELQRRLVEV